MTTSARTSRYVEQLPRSDQGGRPRAATVVIRKLDGGKIGT
jgi:hypothetical protein